MSAGGLLLIVAIFIVGSHAGRIASNARIGRPWWVWRDGSYIGEVLPRLYKFHDFTDKRLVKYFGKDLDTSVHIEKLSCRTGNRMDYWETSYSNICVVREPLRLGYGGNGGTRTGYLYPEGRRLIHLQGKTCLGKSNTDQVCHLFIFTDSAMMALDKNRIPDESLYLQCGKPDWDMRNPDEEVSIWKATSPRQTIRWSNGFYDKKEVHALGFLAGDVPDIGKDCPNPKSQVRSELPSMPSWPTLLDAEYTSP